MGRPEEVKGQRFILPKGTLADLIENGITNHLAKDEINGGAYQVTMTCSDSSEGVAVMVRGPFPERS